MDFHKTAQHLAKKGRGPDEHLVHMSSKELAGLQALAQAHGGSLTQNPETGLPEAGFLDAILPTVIGAGLDVASGGALTPLQIAAGVGGVQALRTGDLGQGLMAGLGAYGGAGMAGSLADLGTGVSALNGADTANMSTFDKLKAGVSAFPENASLSNLGGWKTVGAAAAPALLDMLGTQKTTAPTNQTATITPYTFNRGQQTPTNMVSPTYQPNQDTSMRQWFAPSYTAGTPYTYTAASGGLMALAGGGQTDLGSYSDGGQLLRGPGDGVSDSIPAQIGEHQPARLADGEFVVPARIVSELGNGSTDAGARQLYKMLDRVQNARRKTVGKDKVAQDTNASKFLPA